MEEQDKSHFWRFAAGLAALMALGLGIYYGIGWYEWRNARNEAAANDRALQEMKEWEAKYENDTYGGKTPEETLALFIDALKKGDIELASKYFVADEQERVKTDLKEAMGKNQLQEAADRISRFRSSRIEDERAIFTIANSGGHLEYQALLHRLSNGTWKIIDL